MTEGESVRLRLDIAYDGTNFAGWTKQPRLRTVQGELETALATVLQRHGSAPTLTVAGRTDAGVHARGQVAHVDLSPEQLASLAERKPRHPAVDGSAEAAALARRLNGIAGLSSDVYVRSSTMAPEGFDARFSAVWRRYEYRIADVAATRDPIMRTNTLWYPAPLDLTTMNEAARLLLGLHDWASFCKPREGATTIRTLQEFRWERLSDGVLIARLQADAFCHSMVRSLVGACVAVGEGTIAAADVVELRDARLRTSSFKVLPAKGLTLAEVGYPPDAELAARAERTRARREV